MIAPVSRPAVFKALASAPSYRTPLLWVSYVDSKTTGDTGSLGVAFAISRGFGNAVERNRARRRLREAFRAAVKEDGPVEGAVLVRAKRSVLTAPQGDLVAAAKTCLRKAVPGSSGTQMKAMARS